MNYQNIYDKIIKRDQGKCSNCGTAAHNLKIYNKAGFTYKEYFEKKRAIQIKDFATLCEACATKQALATRKQRAANGILSPYFFVELMPEGLKEERTI